MPKSANISIAARVFSVRATFFSNRVLSVPTLRHESLWSPLGELTHAVKRAALREGHEAQAGTARGGENPHGAHVQARAIQEEKLLTCSHHGCTTIT